MSIFPSDFSRRGGDSFDRSFRNFNRLFIIAFVSIVLLIASYFIFNATSVYRFKKANGVAYSITVQSYNSSSVYAASEIIRQDDRCVTFKNAFGFEETECGNYIGVTKY